ncbi:MAG TPA: growth inhibitor PemK [Caulobacteraceae bacterium]|jgi:hypothetical protein
MGADEAAKDRPCAIVVAAARAPENDMLRVIVAPITHRPPEDPSASMEIPAVVCGTLGLDSGRHWLRLDELNRFAWPGYDLRPIPGRAGAFDYGMLPPGLFEQLRQAILARQTASRVRVQGRE